MSTIVSLRIDTWGNKFIVVGEFEGHSAISRKEFDVYKDALRELWKIVQREEMRYEAGFDSRLGR